MKTIYTSIMNHAGRMFSCTVVCAGMLACAVSCRDDALQEVETDTGGRIAFRVAEGGGLVTRAASETGNDSSAVAAPVVIPLYVAGDTIGMTFVAEPNRDGMTAAGKPVTRGKPFDEATNKVDKFTIVALRDGDAGSTNYFEDGYVVSPFGAGDDRIWETKYPWPSGLLSFCAYTTTKEVAGFNPTFRIEDGNLSGSFSYTLPEADADPVNQDDAKNQPDLVFAMSPGNSKTSEPVKLLFHHALSAIVFKVGTMPTGVTLKSIAIGNVYSFGTCSMESGKKSESAGEIENVEFSWTQTGERNGTYTQTLGEQVANAGEFLGQSDDYTFLMIPQKMGDNTQFSLTFSLDGDGKEYTFSHKFKGIKIKDSDDGATLTEWKPDTKYIFTIGLNGEVDVEVDDKVVDAVKQDVQIRNTGIATGYIRAAIVGYWVDKEGYIQAAWDEKKDGTLVKGKDWDSHWEEGDDGFYYHKQPVEHNGLTYPLFESYTLSETAQTDHANQTLKLSIVAQIVIEGKQDDAWPSKTKANSPQQGSLEKE